MFLFRRNGEREKCREACDVYGKDFAWGKEEIEGMGGVWINQTLTLNFLLPGCWDVWEKFTVFKVGTLNNGKDEIKVK